MTHDKFEKAKQILGKMEGLAENIENLMEMQASKRDYILTLTNGYNDAVSMEFDKNDPMLDLIVENLRNKMVLLQKEFEGI